jgi:hypothetical protein
VLSFYVARTANEGFVRTATEARSVRELARSIGYEPRPGVAASAYLAFTVEDGPGAAEAVPIPAGTRAQSSPEGDQLPQTFETTEELIAHPEWNALRARQTEPQPVTAARRVFYVQGIESRLRPGDWMLLRAVDSADPLNPGVVRNVPLQVAKVEPDHERQHTRVELVLCRSVCTVRQQGGDYAESPCGRGPVCATRPVGPVRSQRAEVGHVAG